jgi:hypothetical protein
MGQPKYTIYKYVRLKDATWRYCRAALYANHTIKADVVIVGHREEKHSEGNYYLASGGQWIPAGADALAAQRQRHALLSANTLEYERHSVRSLPKAAIQNQEPVANGRKKVKDEIAKYLDDMIASKRPGKSVRMNRNFLYGFANLVGKEYADQCSRDDVIRFRNHLLNEGYERKYIDTQMDFVLTFFRHWIKLPIQMERGDRLEYATNPPEPYADEEIIAMEQRAQGKVNLLVRLYRSTGCRLQEITHLRDTDVNPHTKTIFIHEKSCMDCPDCRDRGGRVSPLYTCGSKRRRSVSVEQVLRKCLAILAHSRHGCGERQSSSLLPASVRVAGSPVAPS